VLDLMLPADQNGAASAFQHSIWIRRGTYLRASRSRWPVSSWDELADLHAYIASRIFP
jgi:hypothetical protein